MRLERRRVLKGIGSAVGATALGQMFPAWARPAAGVTAGQLPVAETTSGPVSGMVSSVNATVAVFKGIPYGADTRETRFQPPLRPHPWSEPKVCTAWGPRAPQQSPDRPPPANPLGPAIEAGFRALEDAPVHYHLPPDEGIQSEDCLHLNVWTARMPRPGVSSKKPGSAMKKPAALLPVLVYLHGGAYNNGTVNADLYDGTRLAQTGKVVVVTVNHRLNALGFLYLGSLPGLKPAERALYAESGNAGMLDLVLALEWVRDNIVQFGGDPARVTIFGQSGGGAKCATLMAMEGARGLFHRVLTMSGQQVLLPSKRVATDRAVTALKAMGIGAEPGEVTREQLDGLRLEQIRAGARTMSNWMPVNDGLVLTRDPFEPDAPPISDRVAMILGNTKDEIFGSTAWQLAGLTWETLPDQLARPIAAFKGNYTVAEIIRAYRGWYPAYKPVDVFVAAMAAFRSWPGEVIEAERRASSAEAARRTWVYQMNFPSPTADGRAPHTEDIVFFFDNLALAPGMVGDRETDLAAAQPLATAMSQMLIRFAETGDPNGADASLPHWPVYDLVQRETMFFDRVSSVVSDPRAAERKMMVGAKYRQPGA